MISEQLTQLSNIKADIKSALQEMGQNPSDKFSTYADLIRSINSCCDECSYNDDDYLEVYHNAKVGNYPNVISQNDFYHQYASTSAPSEIIDQNTYNLTSSSGNYKQMFWYNTNLKVFDAKFIGNNGDTAEMFKEIPTLIACSMNTDCFGSNATSMFQASPNLVAVRFLNVPTNFTNCSYMFQNCTSLTSFPSTFPNTTNCQSMFYGCSSINRAYLDVPNATNFSSAFNGCTNLKCANINMKSGYISTSALGQMFKDCNSIISIQGINFANELGVPSNFYTSSNITLRKLSILNLGYTKGAEYNADDYTYTFNFSGTQYSLWGIQSASIPLSKGARKSLIDTLITNSYDRRANNYVSRCTIQLHADTKALLTTNEIAQITAKGYTLA